MAEQRVSAVEQGGADGQHEALAATLAHPYGTPARDTIVDMRAVTPDLAETRDAPPLPSLIAASVPAGSIAATARTTVLPRAPTGAAGTADADLDLRPRFERVRHLGDGGMGEVALVHDHDIERKVAVKRLRAEYAGSSALYRFADEIKTIGQLEHPSIIPIHDVGVDEAGQHYFVMKFVEGDTLETIISRLAAGDPAYVARFTVEIRVQIFVAVLQAIRYAHARGVIHRDIKPANIMVGPFGEVTVMDWGIAKRIGTAEPASIEGGSDEKAGPRPHLVQTQHGALVGTPMYMSPEQAAGKNDTLDERSDVYSLLVLFHELLVGHHYLADKKSMDQVIVSLLADEIDEGAIFKDVMDAGMPAELGWLLRRGWKKDPTKRFQSVAVVLDELQRIRSGEIRANCHVTAFKRLNAHLVKSVDHHPYRFTFALAGLGIAALSGLAMGAWRLVHIFM